MIFRIDPVPNAIETPNGRLTFIEAISITPDEDDLVAKSGADELLPRLLAANPLAVVDVTRSSLLAA